MQNKKSLIIVFVPIVLILILVTIKSLNKNDFSLDANQTHQISQSNKHLLTMAGFKEKLQVSKKTILIDLRNSDDYKNNHLENSQNVPLSDILENNALSKLLSADNEIILYSYSVTESTKAWMLLTQMGYQKLYILDIPNNLNLEGILEKDTLIENSEVLKYKFQPDTLVGLE